MIKCLFCGKENVAVARDMIATRKCGDCGQTWTPDYEKSVHMKVDLAYAVFVAQSRKFTRDYSEEDQRLIELSNKYDLHHLIKGFRDGATKK
jgi:transcription elongation factor Elf1